MKIFQHPARISVPLFLISVIIILFPALYNSYPLVTQDSGAYIENAFHFYVPDDRPITYSVFIRLASLGFSLWGVVIVQAGLLVFFLRIIIKHYTKELFSEQFFAACIVVAAFFTGAGWFCGQIMADIFTPIVLLAIITYLFIPIKKGWQKGLLLLFLWGCIIMHNSHMLIVFLFAAVYAIVYRIKRDAVLFRRSLVLLAVAVCSGLTLCTMNAISGKGFRPSNSSHVFIMCRMCEDGILESFLADNCPTGKEYKLCAYKDKLPDRQWQFQWSPTSPLYLTGGWKANEQEYNEIFRRTITTPKYLWLHIFKSGEAALRQLPLIYVGDGLNPLGSDSNPYWKVGGYYHHELKEYNSSLQQTGQLKFDFFNVVIVSFSFIAGIAALLAAAFKRRNATNGLQEWQPLFTAILVYIFINAFITATFSTVIGRFQSRVAWVLPLFCFVYVVYAFWEKPVGRQENINDI